MHEHAYHLEFGANATAYVEAFMRLIAWPVVTARLTQATAQQAAWCGAEGPRAGRAAR